VPSPRAKPEEEAEPVEQIRRFTEGEVVPNSRYRIVQFLGDGGMGTVYEAEHTELERRVALKILKPELCRNARALRLFRSEAKAASRVGSEHIVDLYDFAELEDGRLFFTMELLRGPTISEEIDHEPLAPARVIAIMRQVCKGLAAAHAAGVVHRDIKPDNVVLTNNRGRADSVKILDFGIAAMLGDEEGSSINAGTPHYAAPELIEGKTTDERTDIYSLGCTAYAMLTGHPPFSASGPDAVSEILAMHLAAPAPSLTRARPELVDVKGLCAVVARCLEKAPDDRYRNMDELEADLCGAQIAARLDTTWDDLPLPQHVPQEIRERLLRDMPGFGMVRPKRSRWLWPTVVIAAVMLGAGITYALVTRDRPEAAPVVAEVPAEPSVVDDLVDDARAAAGQAYYVYPPADDADAATAFSKIRELEAIEGDEAGAAKREAAALRVEFAHALVRIGDSYWEREGGQTFASEYYAQALVFDRSNERALERATVETEDLEGLAERAEKGEFSADEIAAAESRRDQDRAAAGSSSSSSSSSKGAGPRKLAKQAAGLIRQGKLSQAEKVLAPAIASHGDDARVAEVHYDLLRKQGKLKDAVRVARGIAGRSPTSGDAQMRLGRAEGAVGNWPAAYRAFARASQYGASGATKALADAARKGGAPGGAGAQPTKPADPKPSDGGDSPPAAKDPAPAGGGAGDAKAKEEE
jgi:tRNA A-37 threonylcarbamoyl transferase component Bud32